MRWVATAALALSLGSVSSVAAPLEALADPPPAASPPSSAAPAAGQDAAPADGSPAESGSAASPGAASGSSTAVPPAAPGGDAASAPAAAAAAASGPRAEQIERLITALAAEDSYKVRLQAAVLLGRVGDERAVQPLINALNGDAHFTVRAAAATALANLKDPRAVSHLIKLLALDPEPFVREEAARALAKFERQAALPYAVAMCNSPDPRVRKEALVYIVVELNPLIEPVLAKALGDTPDIFEIAKVAVRKMPQADSLRFLKATVDHRDPTVRRGAVDVLRALATPEATQVILRVYERDIEEDEVRNAARAGLRDLREHLPVAAIAKEATSAPEKHTRARALRLLGVVGGDDAEKVLLRSLSDGDAYIRGNAVMAIGDLGNPALAPALEKLVEEPGNQRILHLIRHSLKQLQQKQEEK